MNNIVRNKSVLSKVLTGASVVALIFALNVSGALAGFWRLASEANPTQFLYGFGSNEDGLFSYGYGYGYGYGDFDAGFPIATTSSSSSSGGSGWGGGGGGGWSSGVGLPVYDASTGETTTGVDTPTVDTDISGENGPVFTQRKYPNEPIAPTCGTSIVNFSDISGTTFEDYIIALEKISGLNGNGNGTEYTYGVPKSTSFQPNRTATRSEYVKMILRALCIDYSDMNSTLDDFSDGAVDSWQAKVVNKAADLGWISTSNATFRVNDNISRAEGLKMIMQAGIISSFEQPSTSSFADVSADTWAARYTEAALQYGIIAGNPNFRPNDAILRGESTKLIMNTLFPPFAAQ